MTEWVFGRILNLHLKTHPTFSSTSSELKAPRPGGDLLSKLVNLFLPAKTKMGFLRQEEKVKILAPARWHSGKAE
jgi:hypothetical protein